jgi:hypothetical protein
MSPTGTVVMRVANCLNSAASVRLVLRVVDGWRAERRLLRGVVEELHEEARVEGGGSWRV